MSEIQTIAEVPSPAEASQSHAPPEMTLSRLQVTIVKVAVAVVGCFVLAIYARAQGIIVPVSEYTSLLRWVVIFSAPVAFWLSRMNASALVHKGRRQLVVSLPSGGDELEDVSAMLHIYREQTLASATILAFAALLCITAFFLVGSQASFAMTFVFVAAILAQYPRGTGLAKWIGQQLDLLSAERMSSSCGRIARR